MTKKLDKRFAYSVEGVDHTDFGSMQKIQDETLTMCQKKDAEYGASWCRRGGVGAFFTVWRKADRLEEQLRKVEFNMFDVSDDPNSTESLDETMKDFANYLYLVIEKRKAIRDQDAARARRGFEAGIDTEPSEAQEVKAMVHAGGVSVPIDQWARSAGIDLKALRDKGLIDNSDPSADECGK